jgi:hypothetical protein
MDKKRDYSKIFRLYLETENDYRFTVTAVQNMIIDSPSQLCNAFNISEPLLYRKVYGCPGSDQGFGLGIPELVFF